MTEATSFGHVRANVDRILQERAQKGLKPGSRAELASEMGVTRSFVSRIFKKPGINLETVDRLAKALKISTAELVSPEGGVSSDHPLDECVRRVSSAALGAQSLERAPLTDPNALPEREPTWTEVYWVLSRLLHAGGEDVLEKTLEKWRAKNSRKAAGSCRDE